MKNRHHANFWFNEILFAILVITLINPMIVNNSISNEGNSHSELASPRSSAVEDATYVRSFGTHILGADTLSNPSGIAKNSLGNVYLCDSDHMRVRIYSSTGTLIGDLEIPSNLHTDFESPISIAINDTDYVYVGDYELGEVLIFSPTNQFIGNFSLDNFGTPGAIAINSTGQLYIVDTENGNALIFTEMGIYLRELAPHGEDDGEVYYPLGISVDSSDKVYVCDNELNQVSIFSPTGEFISKFGSYGNGEGEFKYPTGIAINSLDQIFVVDSQNQRIQYFSAAMAFLGQFGTEGGGEGEFSYPKGIAIDSGNQIYITDTYNNRVQFFSSTGTYLGQWGKSDYSEEGQLNYPNGVAVNDTGYAYVIDSGNKRIEIFSPSGAYVGQFGSYGKADGKFESPRGIAINNTGYVYVVDRDNESVSVFSPTGEFIRKFYGFGDPKGIAVDESDNVYIADGGRIYKYSCCGEYIAEYCTYGSGPGEIMHPYGIAVNASGYIFIANYDCRIEIFNPDGSFLRQFGPSGIADGQLYYPQGITIDENGNIIVLDSGNYRIQIFSATGEFIGKFGSYGTANNQFKAPTGIAFFNGTIYIADENICVVKVFKLGDLIPDITGPSDCSLAINTTGFTLRWNATDINPMNFTISQNGTIVSAGKWFSGVNITYSLTGLVPGTYNFSLYVNDTNGYSAQDDVIVKIYKNSAPILQNPSNVNFTVGTTGHQLQWNATDAYPQNYSIYQNGTLLRTGSWQNSTPIIVNLDQLTVGLYNFTIVVGDQYGNTVSDEVIVRVIPIDANPDENPDVNPEVNIDYVDGYSLYLLLPIAALAGIILYRKHD